MPDNHPEGARAQRVLVIANHTCPCPALLDEVATRGAGTEVLLIAPALNASRLKHWVSDSDEGIDRAHARLQEATAGLAERGIEARGEVGDAEPLNAIADALAVFGADEIIIATHPPGESHWLEDGLIDAARERHEPLPVLHVPTPYGVANAA